MVLSYLQKANYFVTDNLKGKLEQNQQQQTNLPLLRSVQNKPKIPLILQNLYFQKTNSLTTQLKKRLQGGGCGTSKSSAEQKYITKKDNENKKDEQNQKAQEKEQEGQKKLEDNKKSQEIGQKKYEKIQINDEDLGKQEDTLKQNIMKDMSESLSKLFNKFNQINASYSFVIQQLEKLDIVNDQNPFEFIKSQLGHFQSFFKEINKISSDQEAQNFLQEI